MQNPPFLSTIQQQQKKKSLKKILCIKKKICQSDENDINAGKNDPADGFDIIAQHA